MVLYKSRQVYTLSKRRCNTTNFPAFCFPIWSLPSRRYLVCAAWFLLGEERRRLTRVSPNALICGTKASAWKLTLQRRRWRFAGRFSKVNRWENGAIAAIPLLHQWKTFYVNNRYILNIDKIFFSFSLISKIWLNATG